MYICRMAEHEHPSILHQLGTLLFLVVMFTLIGQGITFLMLKMGGIAMDPEMMESLQSKGDRQLLRISASVGHIVSFTVSSLIFLYLYHRTNYLRFLRAFTPSNKNLWMSFILLIIAYPIVIKLSEWNMLIPLPEWAIQSSEQTENLIKGILKMSDWSELLFSLFLVGITPAIGEELLYRGIVQNKLIKLSGNEHIGIWIASFLFSLNHLQLERLLPFMMLGLILGYSYHYTKSFWVPVILHFINNSFQVMAVYGSQDLISEIDMNNPPLLPLWAFVLSIFATLFIILFLKKQATEPNYEQEPTA